ncbi:hypothetical protein CV102_19885 [Natronococcus pandeyae]|uniref:Thioredoxin domain-containing protein n=1 Tax=Natronococcus pandeyae TaxID=2055836 RepID=A0A8J8TQZ0_9EURY|nr:redoxin domain-containing protein [Natronococcus pandeyae]TYL37012.1 hypothetical protein CV102_19885 [Natronococcus pandeyae]
MGESDTDSCDPPEVDEVLNRVRIHDFHPVNNENFTIDRRLEKDGIADLSDTDWTVRLLAVRDLVRIGIDSGAEIRADLCDNDPHVRYVCAKTLGILGDNSAVTELERVVRDDPNDLVRSQAVIALGQIEAETSLTLLEETVETDTRDVQHQAEIAIAQIESEAGTTASLRSAYQNLDPSMFDRVETGDMAPEFELPDTTGKQWQRSDLGADGDWLVLIWVFADWCPVCHREFDELIELQGAFAEADVSVATLECHDRFRGRVMVGKELDPEYWFADESFQKTYTERIWWPHLLDRGGAVGATYGVDPLAFAVHAEYINRPATIIVDPDGEVQFAYFGTFWGDRPSVEETLEMIRTETFDFEHPERRETSEE